MSSPETSRLAFVDSLRLIAAALVVLQHLADHVQSPWAAVVRGLAPGVTGVVLFFLISGFVIPFSIRHPFDPARFLVRRLFRIYPLFLVALAAVALLGIAEVLPQWSDLRTASVWRWLANLLLVQDLVGAKPILGVSWTLIIEFAWYGLFAAGLLAFRDRAATVLTNAMAIAILTIAIVSVMLDQRIPLARAGMVFAAAYGFQLYRYAIGAITRHQLLIQLACFLGVTFVANFVSFGLFDHARIGLWQALLPWLLAPLAFTALILSPGVQARPALAQGWLPRCGQWSYSLYLLHPIAIALAVQAFPPSVALLLGAGLSLALAWAGFTLVERPGIALGRYLTRPRGSAVLVEA